VIVVSNTSPITSLAAIGYLNLLHDIYGTIIIPVAVYEEMTGLGYSGSRICAAHLNLC
jgi:predicted nucleic acid-binding protein